MRKLGIIVAGIALSIMTGCVQPTPQMTAENELQGKIGALMAQMTLEEKLGQLSQRVEPKITEAVLEDIRAGKIGSMLISRTWFYTLEERNMLQKVAVEESRLGIPMVFGHDVIHGCRTIFPLSIAQSCTWSPGLVRQASAVAAKEAASKGLNWTFAPMVDVSRDPRWGRIAECYGEDTYLNALMGAAAVQGFQGFDLADRDTILACLKHYAGYGAAIGGRDYQYTEISDRTMHEVYLPPFQAGVDAGALTVMSSFNDISGVPATANEQYVRGVLKEQWGFEGFVISDWNAVDELIKHGIAADKTEAAVKAVNAGIDMEMKTLSYRKLKQGLEDGRVSEGVIDEAVRRVLYAKFRVGLFSDPYTAATENTYPNAEHRTLARAMARESMVLLKNDQNTLPISSDARSIAVVGPFAKEKNLMGWWRSLGATKELVTPLAGLIAHAPEPLTITETVEGDTDLIVACVGEDWRTFGEDHCRTDIRLSSKQVAFLKELKTHGKPVAVVIFNGRPLDLSGILEYADAILLAWHPGTEAGNALADILYGSYNPSGKLTTTFPRSVGQIPIYYNERNSGRPHFKYQDCSVKPLFPFGYGLSYSKFEYSDLKLSSETLTNTLIVSATITNKSDLPGVEVVQLYVRDLAGATTHPVKELKGFRRIALKAHETHEISFTICPEDLTVLDEDLKPVVEAGAFHVWIGPSSTEGLQGSFELLD